MSGADEQLPMTENQQKYVSVCYHSISYQSRYPQAEGDANKQGDHSYHSQHPGGSGDHATPTYSYDDTSTYQSKLVRELPGIDLDGDVPDYIYITFFTLLLFCPLGIPAFRKSLQVRQALKVKDMTIARQASTLAIQLALAAIFTFGLLAAATAAIVILVFY